MAAQDRGAGRVAVVSLATRKASAALSVAPYPGSLALSPDGRFLLVAHFGNFQAPGTSLNALTLIDLTTGGQQLFALSDPPLGVAFGSDGLALVVTSTKFLLLDPVSGSIQVLDTIAGVTAKTLPVPPATFQRPKSSPRQLRALATRIGFSGLPTQLTSGMTFGTA